MFSKNTADDLEFFVKVAHDAQAILDYIQSLGFTPTQGVNAMLYLIAATCQTEEGVYQESEILKSLSFLAGKFTPEQPPANPPRDISGVN